MLREKKQKNQRKRIKSSEIEEHKDLVYDKDAISNKREEMVIWKKAYLPPYIKMNSTWSMILTGKVKI